MNEHQLMALRARLICVLRYKDYLRYASLAHQSQVKGTSWETLSYYEATAREYRARARDAAYIATGAFAPLHKAYRA